jgi:UDP-N-acetylglucosamine--dolichyl-phosphate N-acetylglucosaminephosphotransferase
MILESAIVGLVAFLVTFLSLPPLMSTLKRAGIQGVDVHKLSRPRVPEMGGIAIILGLVVAVVVSPFVFPSVLRPMVSVALTILIAGVVGGVDDLYGLGAKEKPLLLAVAALPILLLGSYDPHLRLPIVGATRLFIVYPFLVLISVSVVSNAVNMLDVYNGSMPITCIPVTAVLFVVSILSENLVSAALSLVLMGSLLAFYWFNRFPARVFSGNVGSLSVGAALTGISVVGRLEVVALVAMMPHVMNAFHILKSLGGLVERREIEARPTVIL